MKKIYLFILFLPLVINGQSFQLVDNFEPSDDLGGQREDIAYKIIPTYEGGIAIVGQSSQVPHYDHRGKKTKTKPEKNDDDILFVLLDKDGNIRKILPIGDKGKQGAYSIIQTFDGGYAIAGYTNSEAKENQANQNAWLVKLDEYGNILWKEVYGSITDDAFKDIIQIDNGNFVLTGHKGTALYFLKVDHLNGKVIEKNSIDLSNNIDIGNAIIELKNGGYFIVGTSENTKGRNTSAFWLSLDAKGNLVRNESLHKKGHSQGIDLVQMHNDKIAILCNQLGRPSKMKLFIVDQEGNIVKEEDRSFFNGKRIDSQGGAIINGIDNKLYLTGSTKYGKGNRRKNMFDVFLMQIDSSGKQTLLSDTWGGSMHDFALDLIQDGDGSFFIVGESYRRRKISQISTSDVFLKKVKRIDPIKGADSSCSSQLKALDLNFFDSSGDGKLQAGERGYIKFRIANTSFCKSLNIVAKITTNKAKFFEKVEFLPIIDYGFLNGNAIKTVSIPLKGTENIRENGLVTLQVNLEDESGSKQVLEEVHFELRPIPKPNVIASHHEFKSTYTSTLERGKPIDFKVVFKNQGEVTAKKVNFTFHYEHNIRQLSAKEKYFTEILPGETKEVHFQFKVEDVYVSDSVTIKIRKSIANEKKSNDNLKPLPFSFVLGTKERKTKKATIVNEDNDLAKNDLYLYTEGIGNYSAHRSLKDIPFLQNDAKEFKYMMTLQEGALYKNVVSTNEEKSNGKVNRNKLNLGLLELSDKKIEKEDAVVVYIAGYFALKNKRLQIKSTDPTENYNSPDEDIDLENDVISLIEKIDCENKTLLLDAYIFEKDIDGFMPTTPESNICKTLKRLVDRNSELNIICSCQGYNQYNSNWRTGLFNSILQSASSGQEVNIDKDGNNLIDIQEIISFGKKEYDKQNTRKKNNEYLNKAYLPQLFNNVKSENAILFRI